MKQTRRYARLLIVLALVLALSAVLLPLSVVGAESRAVTTGTVGARLDQNSKQLYIYLKGKIEAIAKGTLASAVVEIDEATVKSWGVRTEWTNADFGVASLGNAHMDATGERFWAQFDVSAVVEALLHDCPYDLYWFDKTTGVMRACKTYMSGRGNVYDTAAVKGLMFAFTVANDYRPSNYDQSNPAVDLAKTVAANTVRAKAAAIVAKYASASDYEKLVGYAKEICQLVSYNDNAVSDSYSGGYGNPWQAVFVFDGDTDTNVVCEGYSKAFQYLCNLTSFYDHDVACYTVSGVMAGGKGAGNHMWNIVTMGDGRHYIVDITNIDEGTVGSGGELFLAGYDSMSTQGYTVKVGSQNISYVYNDETFQTWGVTESSILRISDADYEPNEISVTKPAAIVYSGRPLTVGASNADFVYSCGGGDSYTQNYEWTCVWLDANGNEIGEVVNAGDYSLRITAVNRTDAGDRQTKTITFTVAKATPAYTIPTGLSATYGQKLSFVSLPTGFAWENPNAYVGSAGNNTAVAIFTPNDTFNYLSVRVEVTVAVAKAIPTYKLPTDVTASYGDRLADVKLPAGFSWQEPQTLVGALGTNTFKATFVPADTSNYQTLENIDVSVTVGVRDIADVTVTLGAFPSYDGGEKTQTIEGVKINGIDVTYTVSGNVATDIGVYTLTLTGTGNFKGTKTVQWRITPDLTVVDSLTNQNVKSSDRASIEAIKAQLAGQENDWAELIARCDALLARVEEVAKEAEAVVSESQKWDAESVSILDITSISVLLDRINALVDGENLTDEEKQPVIEAQKRVDACKDAIESLILKIILIAGGALVVIIVLSVIISSAKKRKKKKQQIK